MNSIDIIKYKGYEIKIYLDELAENPIDDQDFIGTIACFHRRYIIGHKDHGYNMENYDNWDELREDIEKDIGRKGVILPVFMIDHSGIAINTTGFSCPYDSGQVGFIFVAEEKVYNEFGKIDKETVKKVLISEIELLNNYLSGNVYGYSIDIDGENIDSCWGFYGDHEESGLIEYAKNAIDCYAKQELQST